MKEESSVSSIVEMSAVAKGTRAWHVSKFFKELSMVEAV